MFLKRKHSDSGILLVHDQEQLQQDLQQKSIHRDSPDVYQDEVLHF